MPSIDHELPLELIRNRPQLALELLRTVFGITTPAHGQVSLGSETYAEVNPAELRCDTTVIVGDPKAPALGIVVERQLKPAKDKTFTWPAYLAALRARRKCPVVLLVLCPDETTARRCAAPIDLGHPGWVLQPLALSPERLPAVTDPGKAHRLPELAVLSAPIHADGPHAGAVIQSLCAALDAVDPDIGALYHDYVESRFSAAARKLLEETMKLDNYQWQGQFARRHIAEGRVEGEAKSILLVLAARDIPVSDHIRDRVTTCTDLDQLEHWVQRAATINTADELFD
jgi:hypothetical protein